MEKIFIASVFIAEQDKCNKLAIQIISYFSVYCNDELFLYFLCS